MVALDRWIVGRAKLLQQELTDAYDKYDFLVVTQKLMNFCSIELGSFYLDIIKDRQYTARADSVARRSCQTALYHIAEVLVRLMAPIMSFTAQEIWQAMPGKRQQYVFTDSWYNGLDKLAVEDELGNAYWQQLIEVKDAVNKALEQARRDGLIGGSLEAEVTLYASAELAAGLAKLSDELRFVLITSKAQVVDEKDRPEDLAQSELPGLWISVAKSAGSKCVRCWHHREDVGSHEQHPELCGRCIENVDGQGEQRHYA